jgi:hypothetical protein
LQEQNILKISRFSVLVLTFTAFSFIAISINVRSSQACNPFDANCPDLIPDPFAKDKPLGESSTTQEEKDKQELINAIKNSGRQSEDTRSKETIPQTVKARSLVTLMPNQILTCTPGNTLYANFQQTMVSSLVYNLPVKVYCAKLNPKSNSKVISLEAFSNIYAKYKSNGFEVVVGKPDVAFVRQDGQYFQENLEEGIVFINSAFVPSAQSIYKMP